jgi:hypothetical protein
MKFGCGHYPLAIRSLSAGQKAVALKFIMALLPLSLSIQAQSHSTAFRDYSWTIKLRGGDSRFAVGPAMYMTMGEIRNSKMKLIQVHPRIPALVAPGYVPTPIVAPRELAYFVLIRETISFEHRYTTDPNAAHPYFDVADVESLTTYGMGRSTPIPNSEMWSDAQRAAREDYSSSGQHPSPKIIQVRRDSEPMQRNLILSSSPLQASSPSITVAATWQAELGRILSLHERTGATLTFRGGNYRFTVGPLIYMTMEQIKGSNINLTQVVPEMPAQRDPRSVPVPIVAERGKLYLALPFEPAYDDPNVNIFEKVLVRDLGAPHPYFDLADLESIYVFAAEGGSSTFKNAEMWSDAQVMTQASIPTVIVAKQAPAEPNSPKKRTQSVPAWANTPSWNSTGSAQSETQSITTWDMISTPDGPILVPHTITVPKKQQ